MSRFATVTDQLTLAVVRSRAAAALHRVGTRTSSAYQYQPSRLAFVGSNGVFESTPCSAGLAPVTSVVWLGNVTVGSTPTTPLANVPSSTNARRCGMAR